MPSTTCSVYDDDDDDDDAASVAGGLAHRLDDRPREAVATSRDTDTKTRRAFRAQLPVPQFVAMLRAGADFAAPRRLLPLTFSFGAVPRSNPAETRVARG